MRAPTILTVFCLTIGSGSATALDSAKIEAAADSSIVVEPTGLSVDLRSGERASAAFWIKNLSDADLLFTLNSRLAASTEFSRLSRREQSAARLQIVPPTIAKGEAHVALSIVVPSDASDGGPDAFGYVWSDSDSPGARPFEWIGAEGGTVLQLSDDDFRQGVPIGFSFEFYGSSYESVAVGSNGWIGLVGGHTWFPSIIPAFDEYSGMIAPFACDLDPRNGGVIRYQTYGVSPNRYFVVEYRDIRPYGAGLPNTFAVILHEGSNDIRFQYLSITRAPAAIGIESPDQSTGLGNGAVGDLYIAPESARSGYEISFSLSPRWLTLSPNSGEVAPGDSVDVLVDVDASLLAGGAYAADIIVETSDPEHPLSIVRLDLSVTGTEPISGEISYEASGDGVAIVRATPGSASAFAGPDGRFSFTNLLPGTYEFRPGRLGVVFNPAVRSVEIGFEAHELLTFQATRQSGPLSESEPNDTPDEANVIVYGDEPVGSLDEGDPDFYAFYGQAGDSVTITITAQAGSQFYRQPRLFATSGEALHPLIYAWPYDGTGGTLVFLLESDGFHYVRLGSDFTFWSTIDRSDSSIVHGGPSPFVERLRHEQAAAQTPRSGPTSTSMAQPADDSYRLLIERFRGLPPALYWFDFVAHHSSIHATGYLNAMNRQGTLRMDYGQTPSFGSESESIPIQSLPWSQEVSLSLQDLAPNTIYYVRVVATNDLGSTYGPTGILRTAAPPDGWRVYMGPLNTSFGSVDFLDESLGVAAGVGEVVTTSDGGITWLNRGHWGYFEDVFYVSQDTLWGRSMDGTLLRSIDGGRAWDVIDVQGQGVILADFVDRSFGWTVVEDGSVHRTADGGSSWSQVRPATGGWITSMDFIDRFFGWVASASGMLMHTTDGGQSWRDIRVLRDLWVTRLSFADPLRGIAASDHQLLLTEDGGNTWFVTHTATTYLSDIYLGPHGVGIAVGDQGLLLVSEDGGRSWNEEGSGTTADLRSVGGSGERMAAVGAMGTIVIRIAQAMPLPLSWNVLHESSVQATLHIPAIVEPSIGVRALREEDAIGAFYAVGDSLACGGHGLWVPGEDLRFTLHGDDPDTPEKDGFVEGEAIRFSIWSAHSGTEHQADPVWDVGEGRFVAGSTGTLSSLVVGTGIVRFALDMSLDRGLLTAGALPGIRGDTYPLSWDRSIPMRPIGDGDLYVARLDLSTLQPGQRLQFRYVVDGLFEDVQWEAGPGPGGSRTYTYTGHSENLHPVNWSNRAVSDESMPELPENLVLEHNYPNPFNPTTTIRFGLPLSGIVTVSIYDLLGREVARLLSDELVAGYHELGWDASAFASGVYLCRIHFGDEVRSQKLMLVK